MGFDFFIRTQLWIAEFFDAMMRNLWLEKAKKQRYLPLERWGWQMS
jgi:hypothetical protein